MKFRLIRDHEHTDKEIKKYSTQISGDKVWFCAPNLNLNNTGEQKKISRMLSGIFQLIPPI